MAPFPFCRLLCGRPSLEYYGLWSMLHETRADFLWGLYVYFY